MRTFITPATLVTSEPRLLRRGGRPSDDDLRKLEMNCCPTDVPLAPPDAVEICKPIRAPGANTAGTALVVDDNPVNQLVERAMLEMLGYDVHLASNGIDAVLAASRDYDVILMDRLMPDIEGYEATARIRRLEATTRHTQVVAVTASAMAADRDRCLSSGMDDYISKPLDVTGAGRRAQAPAMSRQLSATIRLRDAPGAARTAPTGV
jgi:CheY-like chemotaxis protein